MRRLTAAALLLALVLTGCSGKREEKTLTPEERVRLYETAVTAARDEDTNRSYPLVTSAGDDNAGTAFDVLGVDPGDMTAYAMAVSPMNVKAYAVAAVYPAAGREDAVLEALRSFIDAQKDSFKEYLADQYEIAVNSRLETLEDGTVLLVMCQNQDQVFDAVKDAVERGR